MHLKLFRILFCFFTVTNAYSQERLNELLDSLSIAVSDKETIDYSIKIASELKFSDWERAEHYLNLAQTKSEKNGSPAIQAEFYKKAAHVYYDKDMFDIALNYNLKAYDFYKNKHSKEQYEIENLLGVIYIRLKNIDKAFYHFKRVYSYRKEINDLQGVARISYNIGNSYREYNIDLDSAIVYLKEAESIFKKLNDSKFVTQVHTSIGKTYKQAGNFWESEKYFTKALKSLENVSDTNTKHYTYFSFAEYYLETNKPELSIEYAQKAMDLGVEKYSVNNMVVLKLLYEAHMALNNYKESVHYFREYDQVRDSLNIEEKTFSVEKQKMEYELKARQEISRLNERQNHLILIIVILGLIVILLISGVFIIRYKNRLVKEKLKNELNVYREKELKNLIELKDKELATKTIVETKREEIYNSILRDLKLAHLKTAKGEAKEILNSVLSKLESNTNKAAWEEFEMRFTKVYESFYRNLSEKHPKLSVYDKRVCALIRLNLTTKEIADLTGVTVRSVENTRTRLRKKLNLTNQKIDIAQYLSEF